MTTTSLRHTFMTVLRPHLTLCLLLLLYVNICFALHPIYEELEKKPMPETEDGGPLEVFVGFYVESLGNFRETEMTFDMDMYLYTSWKDPSMRHNKTGYVSINDKAILDKMWLPGLYFANARTAYFHEVTVHNFNMFINPEGVIAYGTRVTLNIACNLHLQNYPLDHQECHIKILSYAHVKEEVNVTWFAESPIRYSDEIGLPEFHIRALVHDYCNGVFKYTITKNSSRRGDFSCLVGKLKLDRAIGFHLVQSYIPTGLIVAISWVSFWIDRRAVPARVSLSFTTLLTLSTQGNGIRYALPPVSYAKAIDYFYGVCMLFIFGVLLEFAVVNSFMRRANKYAHMAEKMHNGMGHFACQSGPPPPTNNHNNQTQFINSQPDYRFHDPNEFDSEMEETKGFPYYGHVNKSAAHLMYRSLQYSRKALAVDQLSRLLFPMTFALFNAVYWLYYLHQQKVDPEDISES